MKTSILALAIGVALAYPQRLTRTGSPTYSRAFSQHPTTVNEPTMRELTLHGAIRSRPVEPTG
jgi:hypothetical protein